MYASFHLKCRKNRRRLQDTSKREARWNFLLSFILEKLSIHGFELFNNREGNNSCVSSGWRNSRVNPAWRGIVRRWYNRVTLLHISLSFIGAELHRARYLFFFWSRSLNMRSSHASWPYNAPTLHLSVKCKN